MRIMGIDPGSQITGFGFIEDKPSLKLIAYGAIRPPKGLALPHRLKYIYKGLCEEIQHHQPEEVAIENVFFAKNAKSALILGHARGAAILSAANSDLEVSEYSPTVIKQAIVGFGRAEKSQINSMVGLLLRIKEPIKPMDASDALATAICHAHTHRPLKKILPR